MLLACHCCELVALRALRTTTAAAYEQHVIHHSLDAAAGLTIKTISSAARLQERLSVSAQHSRAAALAQLRTILAAQLHAAVAQREEQGVEQLDMPPPEELHCSIACLLVRLARRPCSLPDNEPELAGAAIAASRPGLRLAESTLALFQMRSSISGCRQVRSVHHDPHSCSCAHADKHAGSPISNQQACVVSSADLVLCLLAQALHRHRARGRTRPVTTPALPPLTRFRTGPAATTRDQAVSTWKQGRRRRQMQVQQSLQPSAELNAALGARGQCLC